MRSARQHLFPAAAALLFGLLSGGTPVSAATPDTFQPVGNLIEARDTAQATLLTDGAVLVTGGFHSKDLNTATILASAERFDPTTNQFTAVGPMTSPRVAHQAVRRPDGRVLITGGYAVPRGTGLRSAELYDPATRAFTAVPGQMVMGRGEHAAALLPDGRVLIVGGWVMGPSALAEVFDPATGMFQATGSMQDAREQPVAVALRDGRVAVLGGFAGPAALASVEIYDPKSGTFAPNGSLKEGRGYGTAILLPDGRILVAGGAYPYSGGLAPRQSIEIYDPATGQSVIVGMLTEARDNQVGALLPDGRVLVAGGWTEQGSKSRALAEADLVDPTTGAITPAAAMTTPRAYAASAALLDGRVLILGGDGTDGRSLDTAEVYVPASAAKPSP